ncbi:MAG: hypothetical protein AAB316_25445, partial [Bacteroidota bacterium]
LGVDEQGAKLFLNVVGVLDFVVGAGIFLPEKWARPVLLYAAAWGLATAWARIAGNFYWQFPLSSLHQYLFETVFRLPHFLVPMALYLILNQDIKDGKRILKIGAGLPRPNL